MNTAIEALTRLKHEYCRCLDEHDLPGLGRLFTSDAVFVSPHQVPSQPRTVWVGIEQILSAMGETFEFAGSSIHLVTNQMINVSGRSARGSWYFLRAMISAEPNERPTASPIYVGIYQDTFRYGRDGWLIERVEVFWPGETLSDVGMPLTSPPPRQRP